MPSEREMERALRDKVASEAKPLMNLNTQVAQEGASDCCGQSATYAPDPRQLIYDRIMYHQQQIRDLNELLNILPMKIPYAAANGLAKVLLEARPRY